MKINVTLRIKPDEVNISSAGADWTVANRLSTVFSQNLCKATEQPQNGQKFFLSNNQCFLTTNIPSSLSFLPGSKQRSLRWPFAQLTATIQNCAQLPQPLYQLPTAAVTKFHKHGDALRC